MSRPWVRLSLLIVSMTLLSACTPARSKVPTLPRNPISAAQSTNIPTVSEEEVNPTSEGSVAEESSVEEEPSPEELASPNHNSRGKNGVPPPVMTAPPSLEPLELGDKCGTAYGRSDGDWYPGLPYQPARNAKVTGFGFQMGEVRFTDSSRDGLMNLSLDQVHALGANAQVNNRAFAQRLDDVSAYTDIQGTGQVVVRFNYEYAQGSYGAVTLRGQMRGKNTSGRVNTALQQTGGGKVGSFTGRISCADQNGGCENTMITIQRMDDSGNIVREAHVVHRFGSAHIQVTEQDQFRPRKLANSNHRTFATYLSNTVNNSCLAALWEIKREDRKMDECRVKRLEQECGARGNQVRLPAAKAFAIRSYAVAYGRSGFEFAAIDKDNQNSQNNQNARFLISGPLVISSQRPMGPNKLHVEGIAGIHSAHLIANDGGGNLNLQLVFKGKPNSHTRISITTLFEPTRQELQGPIGQMK